LEPRKGFKLLAEIASWLVSGIERILDRKFHGVHILIGFPCIRSGVRVSTTTTRERNASCAYSFDYVELQVEPLGNNDYDVEYTRDKSS